MSKLFKNLILLISLAFFSNFALSQTEQNNNNSELNAKILIEYPGLQSLPIDIKIFVSATYFNIRTAERYLKDIQSGVSTGHVEYHLQFVGETINELKKSNNPVLDKFIKDHQKKLADASKKARLIIGDRLRGSDGIYR